MKIIKQEDIFLFFLARRSSSIVSIDRRLSAVIFCVDEDVVLAQKEQNKTRLRATSRGTRIIIYKRDDIHKIILLLLLCTLW